MTSRSMVSTSMILLALPLVAHHRQAVYFDTTKLVTLNNCGGRMDQSALLPSPGRKRGKRRRSQMACRNPQPQLFDQARGDKGFLQTGRRNDDWRLAGEGS